MHLAAKAFSRPFTSFALLPGSAHPSLTSNIMLVNKDGDLELYAVHDTPVHPPWSPRGDLALGIGCSYTILSGITDLTPPRDPWDLPARPSRPSSRAYSPERTEFGDDVSLASRQLSESPVHDTVPATFGRGDEDGFPALSRQAVAAVDESSLPASKNRQDNSESTTLVKELPFEHTAIRGDQHRKRSRGREHEHESEFALAQLHAPHTTPRTIDIALEGEGHGKLIQRPPAIRALQHVLELDISMLMRRRAILGYGLSNVSDIAIVLHLWLT